MMSSCSRDPYVGFVASLTNFRCFKNVHSYQGITVCAGSKPTARLLQRSTADRTKSITAIGCSKMWISVCRAIFGHVTRGKLLANDGCYSLALQDVYSKFTYVAFCLLYLENQIVLVIPDFIVDCLAVSLLRFHVRQQVRTERRKEG